MRCPIRPIADDFVDEVAQEGEQSLLDFLARCPHTDQHNIEEVFRTAFGLGSIIGYSVGFELGKDAERHGWGEEDDIDG